MARKITTVDDIVFALATGRQLPFDLYTEIDGAVVNASYVGKGTPFFRRLLTRLGVRVLDTHQCARNNAQVWKMQAGDHAPLSLEVFSLGDILRPKDWQLRNDSTKKQLALFKKWTKAQAKKIHDESDGTSNVEAELRLATLKKLRNWTETGLTKRGLLLVRDELNLTYGGEKVSDWLSYNGRHAPGEQRRIQIAVSGLMGVPVPRDPRDPRPVHRRDAQTDFSIRTCPICFRDIKATKGVMADHGYHLVGRDYSNFGGWRSGSCHGVGKRPWEVSPDALRATIPGMVKSAHEMKAYLAKLRLGKPTLKHMETTGYGRNKKAELVTLRPGDKGYDYRLRREITKTENSLKEEWSTRFPGIPWYRAAVRMWKKGDPKAPAVGAPDPTPTLIDRRGDPVIADCLRTAGRIDTEAWWLSPG